MREMSTHREVKDPEKGELASGEAHRTSFDAARSAKILRLEKENEEQKSQIEALTKQVEQLSKQVEQLLPRQRNPGVAIFQSDSPRGPEIRSTGQMLLEVPSQESKAHPEDAQEPLPKESGRGDSKVIVIQPETSRRRSKSPLGLRYLRIFQHEGVENTEGVEKEIMDKIAEKLIKDVKEEIIPGIRKEVIGGVIDGVRKELAEIGDSVSSSVLDKVKQVLEESRVPRGPEGDVEHAVEHALDNAIERRPWWRRGEWWDRRGNTWASVLVGPIIGVVGTTAGIWSLYLSYHPLTSTGSGG